MQLHVAGDWTWKGKYQLCDALWKVCHLGGTGRLLSDVTINTGNFFQVLKLISNYGSK